MLNIGISAVMRESDVDDLADEVEQLVLNHMAELSTKIESTWRSKAESTLNTSKEKYLGGLTVEHSGDKVTAIITGWLPVGVEMGIDRFDMKSKLIGSRIVPLMGADGGDRRFRTMKAGGQGWWHPGIQARKIHEQVASELESTILPAVFGPAFSRRSV